MARPGEQRVDEVLLSDVGPRRSDWLPDLLNGLVDRVFAIVREFADEYVPGALEARRPSPVMYWLAEAIGVHRDVGDASAGAQVAASAYLDAAVKTAVVYEDPQREVDVDYEGPEWHAEHAAKRLRTIGSGRDEWSSGMDALRLGPIRLLQRAETPPLVTLMLDGPAWVESSAETRQRALDAVAAFGEVVALRLVMSPDVERLLERQHGEWVDETLTETRDAPRHEPPLADVDDDRSRHAVAAEQARDHALTAGHYRILSTLAEPREVRVLPEDPAVDIAEGSVYRYISDLAAASLVDVADDSRPHVARATDLGHACRDLLSDDHRLRSPEQVALDEYAKLTDPRQDSTGAVYRAGDTPSPTSADPAAGGGSPPDVEAHLASTGTISDGAEWVQWLDGPQSMGVMDAYGVHARERAGSQAPVSLVDHEIAQFEDGRVCYLSGFEDEVVTIMQWGGPLPTLVRLSAVLLSDKAWGRFLDREALGSDLSRNADAALEDNLGRVWRLGRQIGWFSADDETYEDLRGRLRHESRRQLRALANVDRSDTEDRAELFRDAHGLLATAAQLYAAADLDLQVSIRIPDVDQLLRDEKRAADFRQFVERTIPKSGAYGVHSSWRNLQEDREGKLKRRLGVEVDREDPLGDLLIDWSFVGPSASALKSTIEAGLEGADQEVREQVADGAEEMFGLHLPVECANSYAGTRRVVEAVLKRKGFDIDGAEVRDLIRVLQALLGTPDRGASPFDVFQALFSLSGPTSSAATVGIEDLKHGLSTLPPGRLAADAPPSVGKLVHAVLASDEPLSRSELIERAAVSERTWDRYRPVLKGLGWLSQTDDEWTVRFDPWWSPLWGPAGVTIPGQPESIDEAVAMIVAEVDQEGVVDDPLDECDGNLPLTPDVVEAAVRPYFDVPKTTEGERAGITLGPPLPELNVEQTVIA